MFSTGPSSDSPKGPAQDQTTAPQSGASLLEGLKLSRRDLASLVTVGLAGLTLTGDTQAARVAEIDKRTTVAETSTQPTANSLEQVNLETAWTTTSCFAAAIGITALPIGNLAGMGLHTAGPLLYAAGKRYDDLAAVGQEGRTLASELRVHLKHDLKIAAFLGLLADYVNRGLLVNTDKLIELAQALDQSRPNSAPPLTDTDHTGRPECDTLVKWQERERFLSTVFVKHVAHLTGIALAVAPALTTYTSSTVANILAKELEVNGKKQDLSALVFELALAKEKILASTTNSTANADQIKTAAIKRANSILNGPRGLDKYIIAVCCNFVGALGFGDPPKIFYYLRNGLQDSILRGDVFNFLPTGTLSSLLSARSFFYFHDLGTDSCFRLFSKEIKSVLAGVRATMQAAGTSFARPDGTLILQVQDARGVNIILKKLTNLAKDGVSRETVVKIVESQPQAALRFNLDAYLATLGRYVGTLAGGIRSVFIQKTGATPANTENLQADLAAAIRTRDFSRIDALLKGLRAHEMNAQVRNTARGLARLVEEERLTRAKVLAAERPNGGSVHQTADSTSITPATSEGNPFLITLLSLVKQLGQDTTVGAQESFAHSNQDRVLGIAKDTSKFTNILRKAIQQFVRSRRPDSHTADHATDGNSNSLFHTISKFCTEFPSAISPQAREAMYALFTQVPAVDSLLVVAKDELYKVFGVRAGQKPSKSQLNKMIPSVLAIEAAISAVADNVAAYLFAANLIQDLCNDALNTGSTSKEEFFKAKPDLKAAIEDWTVLVAMQAGSMSRIGNAPNLFTDSYSLTADSNSPMGYSCKVSKPSIPKSFANVYALGANGALLGLASLNLVRAIKKA